MDLHFCLQRCLKISSALQARENPEARGKIIGGRKFLDWAGVFGHGMDHNEVSGPRADRRPPMPRQSLPLSQSLSSPGKAPTRMSCPLPDHAAGHFPPSLLDVPPRNDSDRQRLATRASPHSP
jgi:hypothetical protein